MSFYRLYIKYVTKSNIQFMKRIIIFENMIPTSRYPIFIIHLVEERYKKIGIKEMIKNNKKI